MTAATADGFASRPLAYLHSQLLNLLFLFNAFFHLHFRPFLLHLHLVERYPVLVLIFRPIARKDGFSDSSASGQKKFALY